MKIQTIILLFPLLFIINCKKDSSSPVKEDPVSYTPQHIGDVRQIVSHYDSSTVLWTTMDTVRRSDGMKVFHDEWLNGVQDFEDRYLYVDSKNYLVATLLSKITIEPTQADVNPYLEQRLSKAYPVHDEYFMHTEGFPRPAYWHVKYYGKFKAMCGEFEDTFAFELYNQDNTNLVITTFYAKGVGYIGAKTPDNPDSLYTCAYIKVGNKTYGKKLPAKDKTIINTLNNTITQSSITGEYLWPCPFPLKVQAGHRIRQQ